MSTLGSQSDQEKQRLADEAARINAAEIKAPEITKPQQDVHNRVGEVIYPQEKVPAMSSVRTELDAFKAQQERVLNAINAKPSIIETLGAKIDHRRIASSVTAVNLAENQNLLKELKAASVEDQTKISEFNQKRVEGYAGAIGNASKSILTSVGHGSAEVLKALGGVALAAIQGTGKAAVFLGKKSMELLWAAWYGSWEAYHEYRKAHPKTTNYT